MIHSKTVIPFPYLGILGFGLAGHFLLSQFVFTERFYGLFEQLPDWYLPAYIVIIIVVFFGTVTFEFSWMRIQNGNLVFRDIFGYHKAYNMSHLIDLQVYSRLSSYWTVQFYFLNPNTKEKESELLFISAFQGMSMNLVSSDEGFREFPQIKEALKRSIRDGNEFFVTVRDTGGESDQVGALNFAPKYEVGCRYLGDRLELHGESLDFQTKLKSNVEALGGIPVDGLEHMQMGRYRIFFSDSWTSALFQEILIADGKLKSED